MPAPAVAAAAQAARAAAPRVLAMAKQLYNQASPEIRAQVSSTLVTSGLKPVTSAGGILSGPTAMVALQAMGRASSSLRGQIETGLQDLAADAGVAALIGSFTASAGALVSAPARHVVNVDGGDRGPGIAKTALIAKAANAVGGVANLRILVMAFATITVEDINSAVAQNRAWSLS